MYSLRAATDDDYAFLERLHMATMKELVTRVWGWDEADQAARFRAAFVPERGRIIVVDGRDVGTLWTERRPGNIFIANIEIAPEHQGQGLGTAVIGDLVADARRQGLPVALQVLKPNRARRLYERLGFAITGETATHYLMRTAPEPSPPDEG